jgi:hypothetical protein
VRRLKADGIGASEIAKTLGCGRASVYPLFGRSSATDGGVDADHRISPQTETGNPASRRKYRCHQSVPLEKRAAEGRPGACANQADAIFVLIEAHRHAWHQWNEAVEVDSNLLHSDPLYRAAAADTERRAIIKWDLHDDLFSEMPTTIEGAAALADYCRELHELCGNELEEDRLLDALEKISLALKKLSLK